MNETTGQKREYLPLDIAERLRMEHHMLTALDGGLPDDDTELCALIFDAFWWITQAKKKYGIPDLWSPPKED